MEYLNKFMSAVSTVKDKVDSVLPGNPVTREYEALAHVASAGPGLSWKIFNGYKKSSRKEVSIWLFEKKALENWTLQKDRDTLLDALKSGVFQLTRIRHPRCLHVEHPLEESRESLAFCTEPVFASLANVLGRVDNMPPVLPIQLTEYSLEKIEIQHGLQELTEALQFLHVDAKILHRNVSPESVLITKTDCWKLAGFDFCVANRAQANQPPSYPFIEWDSHLTPFAQPSLNYFAPEYVASGRCDGFSDIYSLGILIYAIYNKGRPLFDHNHSVDTLKKNSSKLKALSMSLFANIPQELKEDLKLCLQLTPELRPDATQFSKITFFENVDVKQIQQLESMCQLDGPQKAQFLKVLASNLDNFSKKLLLWKILPFVAEELKTIELAPFILPIVLFVADKADANEFSNLIFPILSPVFAIQTPYQIPILLLQKIDMFLSKTPPDEIRRTILPLIYSSLDSNMSQLQEPCLSVLPNVVHLMDSKSIKSQLLPKLLQLASDVTVISVKVNALISLGKMIDKLERWMVVDQILPTLSKISSKEPAVLMAILGIFKISFSSPKIGLSKEVCAKHCIPFLISASIENSLNIKQFESFMSLIKEMIGKVETEQRSRLQQFAGSSSEQNTSNSVLAPSVEKSPSTEFVPKAVAESKPTPSGPKALSLEDKRRLAAEQEHTTLMRNKPPLQPLSPETEQKPMKLLSNNSSASSLNLMNSGSLGSLIRPPPPSNPVMNGTLTPLAAPPMSSNPILLSKPPSSQNFVRTSNPSSTANDWSSFLNNSTPTSPPQTAFGNLGSMKNQSKPTGGSAFDDLVVFPINKTSTPTVQTKNLTNVSAKNDLADLLG